MRFRTFLPLLPLLAGAAPASESTASVSRPEQVAWQTGLDLKLDAETGYRGGQRLGVSVHALAQAHLEWAPPAGSTAEGWRGYASVLGLTGHGPTDKYFGDFLAVCNIEGAESARLYTWWLERQQGAWSWRAGALLADEEFTGTESGAHLLNSSFGWPAFISANTVNTGPAFYAAALGARLRWEPSDRTKMQAGIYDGDTFDSPTGDPAINRNGVHYHIGNAQGWFLITETEFATGANARDRWKLGAWLHTGDFPDLYRDASGQPFAATGDDPHVHANNHGYYAAYERTLSGQRGEPGALDAHVRLGTAPADRSTLCWVLDTAVAWSGPLPGRPQDCVTLGCTYARFSRDYSATMRLQTPGDPAPDFEQVWELTYEWKAREGLIIQPDLQWVVHPGGSTAQANGLFAAVRVSFSY